MKNPLDRLAQKAVGDAFFLGCPLDLYAQSEAMNDEALALFLQCSSHDLTRLRLCRTPRTETGLFQQDVDAICQRFSIPADVLSQAVRRGRAILRMRESANLGNGTLLAARDSDPPMNKEDA